MKRYFLLYVLAALFFTSPVAAQTWTKIQNNNSNPAGTPGTITLSSSVAGGNILWIGINWGNNAGTYAVADNASGCTNTWTRFGSVQIGVTSPNALNDLNAYYTVNCGTQAGGITVTVTVTGGGSHGMRLALEEDHSSTGIPASPADQSNSAACNTSAAQTCGPGNITPTVSNTLTIAMVGLQSAGATALLGQSPCTDDPAGGTSGGGWASNGRSDSAINLSSGTSAFTCNFNWTSTNSFASSLIANFKGNAVVPNNSLRGGPTVVAGPSVMK
jgi:hypothetical protein